MRFNHAAVAELIQSYIDTQKELLEKKPEDESKEDGDKKNKDQGSIGNIW